LGTDKHRLRSFEVPKSLNYLTTSLYKFVREHKAGTTIIAFILILLFILPWTHILSFITFVVFLIIVALSASYKMKVPVYLYGPELVTFGTVLIGMAYGPLPGLVFGLISAIISEILTLNLGAFTWLYIISMGIVGIFSGVFSSANVTIIGIISTIFNLLLNQFIYIFIGDGEVKTNAIMFIMLNLPINIILFSTLGVRMLELITYS
jgi:MFS family permease